MFHIHLKLNVSVMPKSHLNTTRLLNNVRFVEISCPQLLGPSTIQNMHVADSRYSPYIKNVDIQVTLILRMIKLVYFYIVSLFRLWRRLFYQKRRLLSTVNNLGTRCNLPCVILWEMQLTTRNSAIFSFLFFSELNIIPTNKQEATQQQKNKPLPLKYQTNRGQLQKSKEPKTWS